MRKPSYIGRMFCCPKAIGKELRKLISSTHGDYRAKVGFGERTDAVMEPRLSTQYQNGRPCQPALKTMNDGFVCILQIRTCIAIGWKMSDWHFQAAFWGLIPAWYDEGDCRGSK